MRTAIIGKQFDEERALYHTQNVDIQDCIFAGPADGESVLKESRDISLENFSSQMTIFKGFNNCYILLQKSRQPLENTKLFTGVLSITSYIVLYRAALVYEPS